MNLDFEHMNVATWIIAIIAVIVVIVGGVVCIMGNMTFDAYLKAVIFFAGAVGLLAIGRGIKAK